MPVFPSLERDGNKYTRGSALIYGGEHMTGAARLAARAAQRIGAGIVSIATPASSVPIYAHALESVIIKKVDSLAEWNEHIYQEKLSAILIGPGAGVSQNTCEFVLSALKTSKPCVLDADALTSFSNMPEALFSSLHSNCVMTPHEGEFAKLFGHHVNPTDGKALRAQKAAVLAGCTVLLKGADTIIAGSNGQTIMNNNAPPWLATAGAGDVLAGIVLGLVTQNMPVFMAAASSAWIHGDIAKTLGPGLIAEDLVNGIPSFLSHLP